MTVTLETVARNAACDGVVDLVDSGAGTATLVCYTAADATLITINLPNPAFGAASVGVATANGTPLSGTASATGTLAKYAVFSRDSTKLWGGSIGTSGADMIVDNTSITSGQTMNVTSWTHNQPA